MPDRSVLCDIRYADDCQYVVHADTLETLLDVIDGWADERRSGSCSLGQSSEASIEIGIARSSVSVSASAQGSGIFRHLGRFSAFFRLFWGILDPTDSD
jgi:hypothetical protein